jgi:hypothetical protein
MVSFRFAMSQATSSRFVPLSSPPPENSKLVALLVPVNAAVPFLCLLYALVILLNSEGGSEPCGGDSYAARWELVGCPPGSQLGGSAARLG